ncbi:transducin beta-like protein 2 [Clytia hemisphaerica]|uniref:Death domain-containing protein n=1 Tax=Clytia hemisphaerica TaxID=252671 RepID=A0A7M6DQL4_9CNID
MADEAAIFVAIALGLLFFVIPLYLLTFRKKEEDEPQAEVKKEEVKKTEPNTSNSQKKLRNPVSKKKVQQNLNDNGINHPYLISSLKGHTGPITSLDFSDNGKLLASSSEDRTVRLWNVKDFREKDHKYGRGNVEFDLASDVAFSPDSRAFVASLANEQKIRVFKIHKEKKETGSTTMSISPEFDFDKIHKSAIISVGISSTGKYIMTADKGTQIIIWSIKGEVYDKIDTLLMYNTFASISPCGNLVAACGFTSEVKLWHMQFSKSGDFQQTLKAFEIKGHRAGVLSFSFTNDSKRFATASKDGTWKVWDINVNYLKSQEAYLLSTGNFTGYEEGLNVNIALTHDYFTVALSVGSHLKYYDSKSGEMDEDILHAHPGSICALRWYTDSKILVSSGGTDRMLRVWENIHGAKANLADLKEKLKRTTSASIKERIEQQIEDYTKFLKKFNKV